MKYDMKCMTRFSSYYQRIQHRMTRMHEKRKENKVMTS